MKNPATEPAHTDRGTETSRLLRAYHEEGDITARQRLIELYLPLVESFAHRHKRGEEYDDVFQAGSIGLINAIDRFDLKRGGELTAFAVPNIVGEIKRHLRDTTAAVRLPRPLQELRARLRRSEVELSTKLGRSPTRAELARALDADEDEVERALSAGPVAGEESQADNGEAAGAGADEVLDLSDERMMLASAFEVLDERERRIIYLRFVRDLSRAQVARELGISERHLSRQMQAALDKLRNELERGVSAASPRGPRPAAIGSRGGGHAPRADAPGRADARDDRSSDVPEQGEGRLPSGVALPKMSEMGASGTPASERDLDRPYHVSVAKDADGPGWTAQIDEIPECQAGGPTADEAARRLEPALDSWIANALASGRKVPEPWSESSHSGRLLLRMPHSLHAELARAAQREGVSLNNFITNSLASTVGWRRQGGEQTPATVADPDGEPTVTGSGARPAGKSIAVAAGPTAAEETTDPSGTRRQSGPGWLRIAILTNTALVALATIVALVLLIVALTHGL